MRLKLHYLKNLLQWDPHLVFWSKHTVFKRYTVQHDGDCAIMVQRFRGQSWPLLSRFLAGSSFYAQFISWLIDYSSIRKGNGFGNSNRKRIKFSITWYHVQVETCPSLFAEASILEIMLSWWRLKNFFLWRSKSKDSTITYFSQEKRVGKLSQTESLSCESYRFRKQPEKYLHFHWFKCIF